MRKTRAQRLQDKTWLGGEDYPLGILGDFAIQMDQLIAVRRTDVLIIIKENLPSENQRKRKQGEVLRPCQRTKILKIKMTVIPILAGALGTVL